MGDIALLVGAGLVFISTWMDMGYQSLKPQQVRPQRLCLLPPDTGTLYLSLPNGGGDVEELQNTAQHTRGHAETMENIDALTLMGWVGIPELS